MREGGRKEWIFIYLGREVEIITSGYCPRTGSISIAGQRCMQTRSSVHCKRKEDLEEGRWLFKSSAMRKRDFLPTVNAPALGNELEI